MRGRAASSRNGEFSSAFLAEKRYGINGTAERDPEGQSLGQGRHWLGQVHCKGEVPATRTASRTRLKTHDLSLMASGAVSLVGLGEGL